MYKEENLGFQHSLNTRGVYTEIESAGDGFERWHITVGKFKRELRGHIYVLDSGEKCFIYEVEPLKPEDPINPWKLTKEGGYNCKILFGSIITLVKEITLKRNCRYFGYVVGREFPSLARLNQRLSMRFAEPADTEIVDNAVKFLNRDLQIQIELNDQILYVFDVKNNPNYIELQNQLNEVKKENRSRG